MLLSIVYMVILSLLLVQLAKDGEYFLKILYAYSRTCIYIEGCLVLGGPIFEQLLFHGVVISYLWACFGGIVYYCDVLSLPQVLVS